MNKDSLGDRMKRYESVSKICLTPRTPVIIRVDGRAFHTFTKKFDKPFDEKLIKTMILAADFIFRKIQGTKIAYIQSDEASFCITDYDNIETQGWFGYELEKMVSISAAMMSVKFNSFMKKYYNIDSEEVFDSRAFNIPKEEVANYFLWRAQDWKRNSIQMLSSSHFSQKELHKVTCSKALEMLKEKGVYWEDLAPLLKHGAFIHRESIGTTMDYTVEPTYAAISKIVADLI